MANTVQYDIFGAELTEGRYVVTCWDNQLQVCLIEKITPKMVRVKRVVAAGRATAKHRYPRDCVLVPHDEEVTMYVLRNCNG